MAFQLIKLLPSIQAAISVMLILVILPQSQGTGIGAAFGGAGTIYRTKRGVEKLLLRATIILGIFFTVVSLLRVILAP